MRRKRNANGSGSVYYEKGRRSPWHVMVTLPDGRRKSCGYFDSKEEANQVLRSIVSEVDAGTFLEPQKMKLAAWLDTWLDTYCVEIKPSTLTQYRAYVRNHIKPALGSVRLCELQPHQVQAFVNNLERSAHGSKPLAYKTMKNIHGCLSAALDCAKQQRYIRDNPCKGCRIPHPVTEDIEDQEIKPLEGQQITAFLSAIQGNRFEAIFQIALFTGLRLSEILGLQWSRVNLSTGEIKVTKQLVIQREAGSKRVLAPTKTRKGRTFIATRDALSVLRIEQKKQRMARLRAGAAWMDRDGLAFTDDIGNSIPHSSVEHQFKRIMERMGLPERRFHDLRHTFATQALRAGVDFKTLQVCMGHSTIVTTMTIYAHVLDDMKQDAADRMQQAFDAYKNA